MKGVLLGGVVAVLLGVVTLPAVLFGGDGPDPLACAGGAVAGDDLAVILATIRAVETGGNYQTRISSATASGAYAFIDSSWRHYAALAGVDIARYPSAWMAPPADQDATAGYYVNEILADHDGRIDVIPVAWYLPSAIDNDARMDVVPAMGANTLTPRQYQAKWMARYELERQRAALPPTGSTPTTDTTPGTPTSRAASARELHRWVHHPDRRRLGAPRAPRHPRRQPRRHQLAPPRLRGLGLDHPGQHTHLRRPWRTRRPHHQLALQLVEPRLRRIRTARLHQLRRRRHHRRRRRLPLDLLPRHQRHRHPRRHRRRRPTSPVVRQHRTLRHRPPPPRDPHRRHPALPPTTHPVALPRRRRTRPTHTPNERMQLLMDHPLSLDEVRDAVGHLTAALIDRQPLDDDQWDHAITTLRIAREQHGGRIRHLIHIILDAGHTHGLDQLHDALTELHCHLAVADDPPLTPHPPRRRSRARRPTPPPHTQLELFADPSAEPSGG